LCIAFVHCVCAVSFALCLYIVFVHCVCALRLCIAFVHSLYLMLSAVL